MSEETKRLAVLFVKWAQGWGPEFDDVIPMAIFVHPSPTEDGKGSINVVGAMDTAEAVEILEAARIQVAKKTGKAEMPNPDLS